MSTDLSAWEAKSLTGDDTVEVRVHEDGAVMWHREGCGFGGKDGALSIGTVSGIPYTAFVAAWGRERSHAEHGILFCGACLIYKPHES
jgi:hypothetical protein